MSALTLQGGSNPAFTSFATTQHLGQSQPTGPSSRDANRSDLNLRSLDSEPVDFPVVPKHATPTREIQETPYMGYKSYDAYLKHLKHDRIMREGKDKHDAYKHDIIHEFNDDITPTGIRYLEKDIGKLVEPINKPFEPFERTVEQDVEKTLEEIYPTGKEELKHASIAETMYFLRWVLNFLFVAAPYWVWSIGMVVLNIVMNIWLNDWWAWGNAFLIFNTVYMVIQTVMSWPLVFEIPWYMSHARFFRIFSFQAALIHTLVYAVVAGDWIYQIWYEPEEKVEETGFLDIFVNMVLGYNIIFHLHTMFVNLAIVVKEFLLLIFPPLLDQDKGTAIDATDFKDEFDPDSYINLVTKGEIPDENQHGHWRIPKSHLSKQEIKDDDNAIGDIFGTRDMYRDQKAHN